MTRLLCVHPGASFSISDVHHGLTRALKAEGVELIDYALDQRITYAGGWLNYCWKRNGKKTAKPSGADVLYLAGNGIIERALRHEVDWVFVVSSMYLHPDYLILMRRAGLKVATFFTECPYDDQWQMTLAQYIDLCWVNERSSIQRFQWANGNTHYLAHAYDPERHHPELGQDVEAASHDVVFVGTGFQERIELLSAVDWTGIDFGLYGSWDLLGSRHPLRKHLREGPIDNTLTAALYRKAKIGLNLHRTSRGFGPHAPRVAYAESLNPRARELAACGTFHISDYRQELKEIFGDLVPTFRTAGELSGQIRHYLGNPDERANIAGQLPNAVKGQEFTARARQILGELQAAA